MTRKANCCCGGFVAPPLPEPSAMVSNNGRGARLGLRADWRTSL